MSERKLKQWLDAGLIDATTHQKISDYETEHARPLGLWAIIGLGALAIGLGVISVVAANWDDIPAYVRLGIHSLLIVGLAVWIYLQPPRPDTFGLYLKDVALFVWAVLGLTFFGHLGQVYQTSSPLWQPLLAWLLLFGPIVLLIGRGWLVSLMIMAGLVGTGLEYLNWYTRQMDSPSALVIALVTSIPVFAMVAAIFMRNLNQERDAFWKQIAQISLLLFTAGVTFKLIVEGFGTSSFFSSGDSDGHIAAVHAAIWGIGAGAVIWFSRARREQGIAGILVIGGLASFMSSLLPSSSSLLAGIIFITFWAAIGGISIYAGWRKVFQAAVAIVALRLIILSFELATDLLASGVGLIMAGVITIGVAVAAYRFSRAFAPTSNAEQSGDEG
ncbi:DUF2157 domain-containing protein [Parasphingorhabdus sp.]|uniref:DUF2157 domain-containing protein n=1 Tax=Parasphingorhabdus sp. TaxID=2709688 RepID=UPI0032663C3A